MKNGCSTIKTLQCDCIYTSTAAKFSFPFSMALIDQIYIFQGELGKYMGSASLSFVWSQFHFTDRQISEIRSKFNDNFAPLLPRTKRLKKKNYPVVQKS